MSEDRPVEEPVDRVAQLERDLHDLRTTLAAQVSRRPVGDVEPTIRKVAKAGTLLLQGQTVNRADQPVLWQWVQDQGLIVPGLFGAGNSTTTFVLPDFRGRVPYGANTTHVLGALFGTAGVTLTEAHIPWHDHDELTGWNGDHSHSGTTSGNGDHPGHAVGASNAQLGSGRTIPGDSQSDGYHSHGFSTSTTGNHKHGIPPYGSSNPTPVDTTQPSIAINWLIWT